MTSSFPEDGPGDDAGQASPTGPRIEREAISPRIEREAGGAGRLVVGPEPDRPRATHRSAAQRGGRNRGAVLALAGVALLLFGFAAAGAVDVVRQAFRLSPSLGALVLAVALLGFGLVLAGIAVELRGLARLRSVDRFRRDLTSADAARAMRAARSWLGLVEGGPALRPAVDALNDPDAVLPLLRATIGRELEARSDALARRAAIEMVAAVAALPAAGLVPLVAWRGVRLVREIAAAHGLRPGLLGTLSLLRRTVAAAATTALAEAAINGAAHAVLTTPILAHLAGEMAGGAVAARRMIVLGRLAAAAASPLRPE